MTEKNIQQQIRLWLSLNNYIPLRLNVGRFFTEDGRPVNAGLPVGTSDLVAIQPGTGRAIFIECKAEKGRPTLEQLNFIRVMKQQGALAGVAYSINDAIKIIGG